MLHKRASRGFTLIEVMIALAVGGVVVLFAHSVFREAHELAIRVERSREVHERRMVAHETLRRVFAGLDLASTRAIGFRGDQRSARFVTLDAVTGRRSTVQLRAIEGWLAASFDTPVPTRLLPAESFAFEYLLDMGADAPWVSGFQSPLSAPLAVRIRLRAPHSEHVDTLLFVIGARG